MKEKKLTLLIMALTLVLSLFRLNTLSAEAAGSYNVTSSEFGAKGDGKTDDFKAIQKALSKARGQNTTTTVTIPKGTYIISDTLTIFSNTTLILDKDAVIKCSSSMPSGGAMLLAVHLTASGTICPMDSTCKHGGYTQIQNVTIQGGTWNRNDMNGSGDNQIISLRHGKNITIKNTTVGNCTNHMINLSGVDTAVVENVIFTNHVKYTGKDKNFWDEYEVGDEGRFQNIEALHLDYMTEKGETAGYPFDGTACRNITVKGCTFNNVFAGVGTHHLLAQNGKAGKIQITGSTFKNIANSCVDAVDFGELIISGNTISNADSLIYSNDSTSTIKGNTITNTDIAMMFVNGSTAEISEKNVITTTKDNSIICDNSNIRVLNNTITNAGTAAVKGVNGGRIEASGNTINSPVQHGVWGEKSTITATGNVINKPGAYGIYAMNNTSLIANGNTVNNAGAAGISVTGCKSSQLSNNTVNTAPIGIDVRSNSTDTKISGNKISNIAENGIYVVDSSTATVSGNEVKSTGTSGIRCDKNSTITASGNVITSAKAHGIWVSGSSVMNADSNTVSNSGQDGIRADSAALNANKNTISNASGAGVGVSGCQNSKITNNSISSVQIGINVVSGSTGAQISGNAISGTAKNAVYIFRSSSATISGNTIDGAGSSGIRGDENSTVNASGNTINSPKNHGIWVTDGPAVNLSSNTINTPGDSGIYIEKCKTGNNISGNTITQPKGYGISLLYGGSNNVIKGNKVTSTGSGGIYVRSAEGCTVAGNVIKDAAGHGIQAEGTSSEKCTVTIESNTVTSTAYAKEDTRDIRISANCTNCVIKDNTVGSHGFSADPSSGYSESGTASMPEIGDEYTVNKIKYTLTSITGSTGTVEVKGSTNKNVTKVQIPKEIKVLDGKYTFKVTSVAKKAFINYKKLKTVSLGSNVSSIGTSAFAQCTKLTSVTGGSGIASIGSKAFYKCSKLTTIGSASKVITLKKVETIGSSAFYGCKEIKKVNITSAALTKIGASAFQGCTKMTSFTEKSTKLVSIGKKAFYGDKSLATISLKTKKLKSSTVGASAFKGIKSTCKFKVPVNKKSSYKKIFKSKGAGNKFSVGKV